MEKKSVIILLLKLLMYHLLKNVDENWRKLLISIFENDLTLKNFLQKYSDGNIQESVYPDKRDILKPF